QARAAVMAASVLLTLVSVATLRGQAPSVPRPPMAEEIFKNVQVLKGIPVDEFLGTMGIIASSIGRGCTECHARDSGGDWATYAEDTPMKQATRRMIVMTRQINE